MTIYTLEQRTKEIGIRKVSGASVSGLVILVSKEYSKLIVIAFVLSAPLAYWVVQQWLQEFEYRITPSPLVFISVGVGTLLVAALIHQLPFHKGSYAKTGGWYCGTSETLSGLQVTKRSYLFATGITQIITDYGHCEVNLCGSVN